MEEKKIIKVEVREDGIDELNADLKTTKKNLDDVEGSSGDASKGLKAVGENGGAISVLDSLTGGLATRIRDAAEASKLFNFNLKATKAALLATGIGAFVVVLGTVVAYWDDIVDFINQTNKKLEEQLAKIQRKGELLEGQLAVVEAEEELLKAQGKATDEIIAKKRTLLQAQIGIQGAELATLQAQKEQLRIELARDQIRRGYIDRLSGGLLSGGTVDTGPLAELEKQISDITVKVLGAQSALAALSSGQQTDENGNVVSGRDKALKTTDFEKDGVTGLPIKQIGDATIQVTDTIIGSAEARRAAVIKNEQMIADAIEFLEERKKNARLDTLQVSANALMAFGDLVGQTTGAGKALASAGALVNTFLGITEVLSTKSTLPEPFATISRIANIATVTATGFAAVKQINSVQIPNTNINSSFFGGRGGAPAAPQIQQPNFNIVGDSGVNQLADVIREKEAKPVRAYVVSDDVRSQSELDRNIRASSTI